MRDVARVLQQVHLRYGTDAEPGIRRLGTSKFRYRSEETGRPPAAADLERIRQLAVPPAWTDVWIAADSHSHLQATGRDQRGRKQYRYHAVFADGTAALKFGELIHFGLALGSLRRRVQRDLSANDLTHDCIVAVVVRLLDVTSLRVGNESYARENKTFGLTTLRSRHVAIRGTRVNFGFVGKSQHRFDLEVASPVMARLVRKCQDLPGQMLFQYRTEDGALRPVTSQDVNEYLAEHCGSLATAKTFRTWNASLAAGHALSAASGIGPSSPTTLNQVIDTVADELGNTRAVCRRSYVHPALVTAYMDGSFQKKWEAAPPARPSGLSADERRLLRLLRRSSSTSA